MGKHSSETRNVSGMRGNIYQVTVEEVFQQEPQAGEFRVVRTCLHHGVLQDKAFWPPRHYPSPCVEDCQKELRDR